LLCSGLHSNSAKRLLGYPLGTRMGGPMKVKFTDRFVANVKAVNRIDYFDEGTPGLALRVSAKHKAWTFHFTLGGKRARLTLGSYPATSLAAARARALEAKSKVESDIDPRLQDGGAMNVAMLTENYIANHVRPNVRRADWLEGRIKRNILPVIGNVRLADLHRRDAARVTDPIIGRGSLSEAEHAFADLRTMLRWAVARGDLDHNPIEGVRPPSTSKPRERVLSDDEIRALWNSTAISAKVRQVLRLCLLTAQRIGEVSELTPGELDLTRRLWSLPGTRTKNGHPHAVPLSALAIELLGSFTNMIPQTVARAIYRAGFGWTAHDLRRTVLTRMAELGIAPIVLGHIANHRTVTKAGMTLSVYVQHAYEREKREALELWADRLQGIIEGAKVVPMVRS
jgi:integrase